MRRPKMIIAPAVEPVQHVTRPPARYDNVPGWYGIADELHGKKLTKFRRDQNGIHTTYLIK